MHRWHLAGPSTTSVPTIRAGEHLSGTFSTGVTLEINNVCRSVNL